MGPAVESLGGPAPPNDQHGYVAFISYHHKADQRMANRLQSVIERWGGTWRNARTMRVFRDETNLDTRDIGPQIEAALDRSRFLIVLASPAARDSHWVNKEIDYFFRRRDASFLCVVLTDGTTRWTDKGGPVGSTDTAIPEALWRHLGEQQPLVIDLRPFRRKIFPGSRYDLCVASIVAHLLGKNKDSVYDQHLKRQRKTQAALAIAMILFVALVGLAAHLWGEEAMQQQKAEEAIAVVEDQKGVIEQQVANLEKEQGDTKRGPPTPARGGSTEGAGRCS